MNSYKSDQAENDGMAKMTLPYRHFQMTPHSIDLDQDVSLTAVPWFGYELSLKYSHV